ncbi:MAG TPA: CbrC family protein [Acidimicrobiales bacterium]|nr:CbrC family protein [Acidimicrobiales bacterium]
MVEPFPQFRYHPDPIATGAVERSEKECLACGRARAFIYVGPVFAEAELVDALCPWCIGSGTAAERFDAQYTDVSLGVPVGVPTSATDDIAHRTPGFRGWQQEHWLYHCDDGCAFMGEVGRRELDDYPDALAALRRESQLSGWGEDDVAVYLDSLTKGGAPTAYLFRCLTCGVHLAYSDFD